MAEVVDLPVGRLEIRKKTGLSVQVWFKDLLQDFCLLLLYLIKIITKSSVKYRNVKIIIINLIKIIIKSSVKHSMLNKLLLLLLFSLLLVVLRN